MRKGIYRPKAGETYLEISLTPEQVTPVMQIAERYGIAMELKGNLKDGFRATFKPDEMACGGDWSLFLADLYQAGIKLPEMAEKEAISVIEDGGV